MRSVCRETGSARRRHHHRHRRRRRRRQGRPDLGRFRRHSLLQVRRHNQGHRRFLQYPAPGRNLPRLVPRHSRAR